MTALAIAPGITAITAYRVPRHPAPIDLDLTGTELPPADPKALADALAGAADCWRYPNAAALEALIAERWGITPDRVLASAGSDDALERAFRTALVPGSDAVLTVPTFEMFPRYAALSGAPVRAAAWPDGDLSAEAVLASATPDTRLIAVVSPNNPTGTVATAEALLAIARGRPDALLVVDGAYAEFANEDPLHALLAEPNVLVTRTLSKAWGMPGFRVGFAAGPVEVITAMRRAGTPYPMATPALEAARQMLAEGSEATSRRVATIRRTRTALLETATSLGLAPTASEANFICTASPRAEWLRDGLAGLGIGVRWLPGNDTPRVRISCPLSETDTARLTHALRAVLTPEAVLLDMDGVIADVSRSYRAAIIATAGAFGVTLTADQVRARKAAGGANDDWALTHELVIAGGGDATLEAVTTAFERRYQGTDDAPGLRATESLLGGRALLARLAAHLPLAIVTGRPRVDAERFLAEQGIAEYFTAVVTREDGPIKPSPFPVEEALRRLGVTRAWMVGDTPDDLRAARGAQVVPLGIVAPGDDPVVARDTLFASGAARVLTDLEELFACLT
jgi:HAD superfamily hydrolase (TIGR01548 family)